MSRSGYSDDYNEEGTGLWRGAVARSISGKRGQAALKELSLAMDAMPVKTLAAESLITEDGASCTLGVLGHARGLDMNSLDPEDWDAVAKAFNIAPAMVREIVYENDEGINGWDWVEVELRGPVRPYYPDYGSHTQTVRVGIKSSRLGKMRWARMRNWVKENLNELVR